MALVVANTPRTNPSTIRFMTYDVAVIGAGVFGVWSAYQLRRTGRSVLLLDAYGPGNSRASSGGESRIMRLGYGPDEIYTRSAQRSLQLWQEFFAEYNSPTPLFHPTGMLWLARHDDAYSEATLKTLKAVGARCERLDHTELTRRFSQFNFDGVPWGIIEPDAGVLMAAQIMDIRAEQKETIDPALLQQISSALKIPAEAIQNFDEEQAVNIIANTFDNGAIGYNRAEVQHFNPVEKLVQLHEEKIALYERMLKEKDEMMARLEKLIEK